MIFSSNKINHFEGIDSNSTRSISEFLSHADVMAVSEVSKGSNRELTTPINNRIKSILAGKKDTCQKSHHQIPRSPKKEMMEAAIRQQKKDFYKKISTEYCIAQGLVAPITGAGGACATGTAVGLWGGMFSMCCPYSCAALGVAIGWAAAGVAGVACAGGTVKATAGLVSGCMEELPPLDMRDAHQAYRAAQAQAMDRV